MKIVIYFFSTEVYFNCECGNEYFYGEVVCDTWLCISRNTNGKNMKKKQNFNSTLHRKKNIFYSSSPKLNVY